MTALCCRAGIMEAVCVTGPLWDPGQHWLPVLASSFLTSMTLESLKPGMRSSLQMTPASSSWLQSLFPQPRCLQSPMLFSLPAQFTLSSQIRPARHQGWSERPCSTL